MKRITAITTLVLACAVSMLGDNINRQLDSMIRVCNELLRNNRYAEAMNQSEQLLQLESRQQRPAFMTALKQNGTRAKALAIKAECLKGLGEYDKANTCYEEAVTLAPSFDKDRYRYGHANLLVLLGNYRQAIDLIEGISAHELAPLRLITLAHSYFRRGEQGDTRIAESLLDSCLNLADLNTDNRASALQNRGYIHWQKGEYPAAEQMIAESLDYMTLQTPDRYVAMGNLALVQADLGNFDSALENINTVISWQKANNGTSHPDYIISLRKKAEILLKADLKTEARKIFGDYFDAEKKYILRIFPNLSQQSRLDFWYSQNPLVTEIFQLKETDPAFLYDVALFKRQMAMLPDKASDPTPFLKGDLRSIRARLRPGEAAVEFISYYDDAEQDSVYCAIVTDKNNPTKYVQIINRTELHNYHLDRRLTFEQAVCSNNSTHKRLLYNDTTLAAKIWAPVLKAMPTNITKIYFAPDGILQMLAIEHYNSPLLKGKKLRRLISTSRLLESFSASRSRNALVIGNIDYNFTDSREGVTSDTQQDHRAYDFLKNKRPFSTTQRPFNRLKNAVAELDSVAWSLGIPVDTVKSHTGEEFLKHNLHRYNVAHILTHGYSLKVGVCQPPQAMRDSLQVDNTLYASGLALQGANTAGRSDAAQDGILSSREICELDLSQMDFIVLSACQTAQGIISDEGPAGVVRSLKKAGASSILATLWKVDDRAASIFMTAFYKEWARNSKTKEEAFQKAINTLKNYTDEEENQYSSPYYWAPFILIDAI